MEETEFSETSVCVIQKPKNHPKERIQYAEHGESFKPSTSLILGFLRCLFRVMVRK